MAGGSKTMGLGHEIALRVGYIAGNTGIIASITRDKKSEGKKFVKPGHTPLPKEK